MSNIKPLHDRVVIKRMEEEKLSAGGIVIPDSATEKPIKGEVVAVGTGKVLDNGQVRAPQVKVGDKVLFGKYSGTEGHCCKVSDEAAFCLIQRPYISKTLLTRRISPRGSP